MSANYTFTIIKPCAVKSGYVGAILSDIQNGGFEIAAMKFMQMTQSQAETFYQEHKERYFFNILMSYMISSPIVVAILKRDNAVEEYRKLIGATDPASAVEGTIRKKYAKSIMENAVHGSDNDEHAVAESNFFFSQCERFFL